jgi:transcriptional regulator GlxA family with amidase domain
MRELNSLGQEDCPIRLLDDGLEGSESFLESAAQHLLWLKYAQPEAWHQPSVASTQAAMVSFVAARMLSSSNRSPAALPSSHQLASYVDLAMSYMEQSLSRPISLGDLCEACHVSARTLQIAFRQLREETPLQALRGLRLKQMRNFLLQGDDVSVACSRSGLSPTGRTSALYSAAYGEKPSQTSAGLVKRKFLN